MRTVREKEEEKLRVEIRKTRQSHTKEGVLSMTDNTRHVSERSFLSPAQRENSVADQDSGATKHMDFSLFYFARADVGESSDKYRLLIEGAKFADVHGFASVWTPERHFKEFCC